MPNITHQMHVPHDQSAFTSILRADGRKVIGASRPVFSFAYDAMNFMASQQVYFIGQEMIAMSQAQIEEVIAFLETLHVSEVATRILADNVRHLQFLKQTDWYVTRHFETGKPIPEDIAQARARARDAIQTVDASALA